MTAKLTSQIKSPIGNIEIMIENDQVSSIRFMDTTEKILSGPSHSGIMAKCIEELQEYFQGSRKSFTTPINPCGSDFESLVWKELHKIPYGATISYEQLSIRLGNRLKIRAAAKANGKNPIPIMIPCHRVIGKDGSLVGFSGGLSRKEWLLSHEGAIGKQVSIF